jgi:hypothetical protein
MPHCGGVQARCRWSTLQSRQYWYPADLEPSRAAPDDLGTPPNFAHLLDVRFGITTVNAVAVAATGDRLAPASETIKAKRRPRHPVDTAPSMHPEKGEKTLVYTAASRKQGAHDTSAPPVTERNPRLASSFQTPPSRCHELLGPPTSRPIIIEGIKIGPG